MRTVRPQCTFFFTLSSLECFFNAQNFMPGSCHYVCEQHCDWLSSRGWSWHDTYIQDERTWRQHLPAPAPPAFVKECHVVHSHLPSAMIIKTRLMAPRWQGSHFLTAESKLQATEISSQVMRQSVQHKMCTHVLLQQCDEYNKYKYFPILKAHFTEFTDYAASVLGSYWKK